jgi:hypothetical protein
VGVVVAVIVTVSPETDGLGEDSSAVFVGIRSTTWFSLPVDAKQLSSPLSTALTLSVPPGSADVVQVAL